MTFNEKQAIKFFTKYADKWHSYAADRDTTEIICALTNLGILKINDHQQAKLKSRVKAEQFLANI